MARQSKAELVVKYETQPGLRERVSWATLPRVAVMSAPLPGPPPAAKHRRPHPRTGRAHSDGPGLDVTAVVGCDTSTGCLMATALEKKGSTPFALQTVTAWVCELGHARVTLQGGCRGQFVDSDVGRSREGFG